jgi:predicted nucleic acid-binding Zn ribbon protein
MYWCGELNSVLQPMSPLPSYNYNELHYTRAKDLIQSLRMADEIACKAQKERKNRSQVAGYSGVGK